MNSKYLLLLLMPVMVTAGQLLLKKGISAIILNRGILAFVGSFLNLRIIAASLCVAAAPLLYINVLDTVPLSEAFAFNSLNYVLVFITGRVFLKERVNALQVSGVIMISAGFLLPFIVEAFGA